jgi:Right handed beta helix region
LARDSLAPAAAAVVAALACLVSGAAAAPSAVSCTFWASDRGNDGNIGTQTLPFRTVNKLLSVLRPGETGCLFPGGVFQEQVRVRRGGVPGAPVRLVTAAGRRAVIRGTVFVPDGSDNVVLASLVVRGEGAPRPGIVDIAGNGVALIRSDVSGPGYLNRSIACVHLRGTIAALLDGNTIHNCTRVTRRRGLYSQGIWVDSAQLTTIVNNFVYHTAGDGIALAPNAQNSKVSRNLIDGNVSGVYIGGDGRRASSANLIVDNIVSYSGRYNIHSSFPARGPVGHSNLISRNCLWKGFRANLAGRGYAAVKNLVRNPRYLDRPRSLALRPGTRCFAKRPASYRSATTNLASPYPVLGAFLVSYRLRALRTRVQVVGLALEKLLPGAAVEVRCVRGCRLVENLRASRTGTATIRGLRGRWLRRGAIVEIRARVPNWVGAYAQITVTGLPRGVRIDHRCLAPTGEPGPVRCTVYTRG